MSGCVHYLMQDYTTPPKSLSCVFAFQYSAWKQDLKHSYGHFLSKSDPSA